VRQCRPATTDPGLSGSGCSPSTERSARSCAGSSRVLGSCPHDGHSRLDHPMVGATTTGAVGVGPDEVRFTVEPSGRIDPVSWLARAG